MTFGTSYAPPTLNPGIGDPAYSIFYQLAYDPLVVLREDGTYTAGLATKWGYTDKINKVYELALRSGVVFSDGTALTADSVKKWFLYEQAQAHSPAQILQAVKSIDVTGPLSLRLNLSTSDPGLTFGLAQSFGAGYIASPTAAPASLNTATAGTGPYMIDAANTVAADHYTYVPNPRYWNPAAVHWKKVVIRVIPNPSTMLQALNAGQVQVAVGDSSTTSAAKGAGLTVLSAPQILSGINLVDRTGKVAKPLGDVRVRQALNLAIDRQTIAKALYGDSSLALAQYALKGQEGYDETLEGPGAYDVAKAKQLLTAAGYPNGFTLSVLDASLLGQDRLVQAMSAYLAKIGVTLQVTTKATANDYFVGMTSGTYPAVSIGYGLSTLSSLYVGFVNPKGPFNPLHTDDAKLTSLYGQYFAAQQTQAGVLAKQINDYLAAQAWAIPVVGSPIEIYETNKVTGLQITGGNAAVPLMTELRPN